VTSSAGAAVSVSVITPTLNASRYLEACLTNVQSQQIVGLEHVVVDGGSTDATAAIAQHRSGVTWVAYPGSKQSAAINAGVRRSSCDIVAWLNADDLYTPAALAFVVDRFSRDPRLDVLYGDCEVIGPDHERLWWERPGAYDFRRLLRRGNYIAQPAVFLRRRVFDLVGYLDESLEYAMDYDLWLRVRGLRVVYEPRSLARFRWYPESKSGRSQIEGWREFLRILGKHGGGWTPELVWAYTRCLVTLGRLRLGRSIRGSTSLRPLTRGAP
jgi:glycosyltransferase involved in cell wall biosynthesis